MLVSPEKRPLPGDDQPPAHVLEELLAAFGPADDAAMARVDLDDPAIDRMLGLEDLPSRQRSIERSAAVVDDADDAHGVDDAELVDDAEPVDDVEPVDDADLVDVGDTSGAQPPAVNEAASADASKRIIVIPEDDLPDAVYLDEPSSDRRVEEGGTQTTIVIGDVDDTTAETITIANSTMEPRLRARRIAVNRAMGRKRIKYAVAGVLVLALLAVGLGLLATNAFGVKRVQVEGVRYADQSQLDAIVSEIRGSQLLLVDTVDFEQRLEAIAWVEQARVDRDFPSTVVIDIRERTPVAFYQGSDGRVRVIDHQSRVLDVIDGLPVAYVHIVSAGPDLETGQFAGTAYATAGEVVLALPPELRRILVSMSIDASTGDLSMVLEPGVQVRFGDGSRISQKLRRLLQVVRNGLVSVTAIDVTSDDPTVTRSG